MKVVSQSLQHTSAATSFCSVLLSSQLWMIVDSASFRLCLVCFNFLHYLPFCVLVVFLCFIFFLSLFNSLFLLFCFPSTLTCSKKSFELTQLISLGSYIHSASASPAVFHCECSCHAQVLLCVLWLVVGGGFFFFFFFCRCRHLILLFL